MTDELRIQTASILSEVLKVPVLPDDNPTREQLANWDSLNHMELILRLEEHFQVRFNGKEVAEIQSLDDLIHIIGVKL